MQYLKLKARRLFILQGLLWGNGELYRPAPDQCWSHLDVKN